MESRRVIHYNRNSIKPRKVSMPSIQKRMRQEGVGVAEETRHMPPMIDKVYATKNCMWCPADFEQYQIVCSQCHNCQYCGMVSQSFKRCNLCGNRLADELIPNEVRQPQKIRIF